MSDIINDFRGYYAFLSNMYPCKIKLGSVVYECAEAAFQAVKLADKSQRKMFAGLNGKQAKALGRKVKLRSDWEDIKVDVMRWVVTEKFQQNPGLRLKLYRCAQCATLVERNTWGDTFWGICNGVGENWLGKILMEYAAKEPAELHMMEEFDDVPWPVAKFKFWSQAEDHKAGFDMMTCQYYKCGQLFAIRKLIKNQRDECFLCVDLVTADGTEYATVVKKEVYI